MLTVQQALPAWQADCQSRGQSPRSIEANSAFAAKLVRACEVVHAVHGRRGDFRADLLNPSPFAHDCITAYFTDISKLSQASMNKGITVARSFLAFLERRAYVKPGTTAALLADRKVKAAERRPKYYIPVEHFSDLLEISESRHPCERAVMALALYTLARQGEIASLRLRDVDLARGVIRIYRSKRKRWTDVTISPDLAAELDKWLSYYAHVQGFIGPSVMMHDKPDWFLTPRLEVIRNAGIYDASLITWRMVPDRPAGRLEKLVKRCLDGIGADTADGKVVSHLGEGMHTIRRSGARAMLDHLASMVGNDKALLQVSIMLDHDDPKMTLLYIGRNIERDRLNDYLKTGSMYGPAHRPGRSGDVVPLRREVG